MLNRGVAGAAGHLSQTLSLAVRGTDHDLKGYERMEKNEWPDYDRAPIEPLEKLCGTGGLLRPLMCLNGKLMGLERKAPLDVHFRRDEIHVYCGHPRVFRTRLLQQTSEVETEMRHARGESSKRRWSTEESADLESALNKHLEKLDADSIVQGEGVLQARWAGLGHGKTSGRPWTMIDREVRFGYANKPTREKADAKVALSVGPARRTIEEIAERTPAWTVPTGTGGQLDQLGVDEDGNLVLVEIKDAMSASAKLYYAPLQLLHYVHLWHRALQRLALWERIRALIDARHTCGLGPEVPPLSGGVRAAVCFGSFGEKPSDEVKRRFYEVLGVVNAHLPSGVPPIETWKYEEGGTPEPL